MLPAPELAAVALPPVAYLAWIRYLRSPAFRASKVPIQLLRARRQYNLSMSAYSAAVAIALRQEARRPKGRQRHQQQPQSQQQTVRQRRHEQKIFCC